jgi:drug/metabolite transporter (DMT)-like permease
LGDYSLSNGVVARRKKFLESHTELQTLVYGCVVAIVLCAVISILWDPVPFYHLTAWPLRAWIGVAVLGVMWWGIAMVVWFWLLKQLQLTQISVSVYMLPIDDLIVIADVDVADRELLL